MRTITLKIDGDTSGLDSKTAASFKRLQQEVNNFNQRFGKTTTGATTNRLDSDLRKAAADTKRFQQERVRAEKELTRQIEREAKAQSQARAREMKRSADAFIKEIDRMQKAERAKRADGFSSTFGSRFAVSSVGAFTGNLAADAVVGLTGALKDGAAALVSYSARMEQTKIGFTTLLGGASEAAKHIKDLQKFAIDTPFEFEGLAKLSQRLQGAGVQVEKVIPLMRDFGNIVAATGEISAERLEGVSTALSQIISKGRVSAEEMEQLAERGIPAWKLLAEATGKTQTELRKMSEQGQLSSDVLVAALQKISREKFGDSMEKQSKTALGALSTIKDVITQTAANTFQPLFDEGAKFTVRFAQDIQRQGKDLESIGSLIAQYIGEGLAKAIPALAVQGGKNLANVVAKTFKGEFTGLGFYGVDFLSGVVDGLTESENKVSDTANTIQAALNKVKTAAESVPNIAEIMKADLAKKQAEEVKKVIDDLTDKIIYFGEQSEVAATKQKLLDKGVDLASDSGKTAIALARRIDQLKEAQKQTDVLVNTVKNLGLQIKFFGDESQVAATKQQLLNAGITDFSSGLAKAAILQAERLDQLKKEREELDKYNDRLKSFSDELTKIREDADFELRFINPTELDKFNEKVRRSGLEFSSLKNEIEETRKTLLNLQRQRAARERNEGLFGTIEDIQKAIRDLENINTDEFKDKLSEISDALNLKGFSQGSGLGNQIDITNQVFAEKVKGFVDSINVLNNAGIGVDKLKDDFTKFLQTFKTTEGLDVFATDKIPQLIELFVRLGGAMDKAKQASAELKFQDITSQLNDEIQQLNIELGRSAELSRADQIAKELQKDAYKDLTEEQRKAVIEKAKEIDSLKAAQKAQEDYQRAFERTADIFEDALDRLAQGDWKGFFQSLDEMRRFLVRAAAEWLASKFFKLVSGQGAGNTTGGGLGNILQVLTGGGIFGGGTPPFNPNLGPQTGDIIRLANGELATQVSGGGGGAWGGWRQFANDRENLKEVTGGGIFGKGGIFGAKGFGFNAGTVGGIGAIASVAGGLIGGRFGNILGLAGTGASIGAMFGGPIGGVIGAGIGAIAGLFGGDPKRKADKKENLPKLQAGFQDAFKEFSDLIADVNSLRTDPDSALGRGRELRNQIASGFGITFQSKKYKKQSQELIKQQLAAIDAQPDGLMAQLAKAVEIAKAAGERNRRILPEFADGGSVSSFFRNNFSGLVPGIYDRADNKLIRVSGNEVVLTPSQWRPITPYLASANVPGFANGGAVSATSPMNFNIILEGVIALPDSKAYLETPEGERKVISIINKGNSNLLIDPIKKK